MAGSTSISTGLQLGGLTVRCTTPVRFTGAASRRETKALASYLDCIQLALLFSKANIPLRQFEFVLPAWGPRNQFKYFTEKLTIYIIILIYDTSEESVSHNVFYYQQLFIARYNKNTF